MPDIPEPGGLTAIQVRDEGQGHTGGGPPGRSPKSVADTYQESERSRPPEDRITIIGIPIEQITPITQAALAGLVAENATLRSQVRRLEGTRKNTKKSTLVVDRDGFVPAVDKMLASSPGANGVWIFVLIHILTFDDIRRNSGILAANTALDDVVYRLRQMDFDLPEVANDDAESSDAPPPRS